MTHYQIINSLMKRSKTSTPQTTYSAPIKKLLNLEDVFRDCHSLGWQVLDAESKIYTQMQVNMQKITQLTELYMRVIEKLNSIQDQRQHYFTFKMQKLMSEPYIIRFFNNQTDTKRNNLDDRRKKLEQKIQKQAERQNHKVVVEEALRTQEEKQKKMIKKIKDFIDESEKSVELRIRKRNEVRQYKNSVVSPKRTTPNTSQSQIKTGNQATVEKTSQSETSTSRFEQNLSNSPTLSEEHKQSQKLQEIDNFYPIILSESKLTVPKKGQ